jgi:hypothetical protein
MNMTRALLIAILSPLAAMASVIVNCPNSQCEVNDVETAVGNIGTIDFGAGFTSTTAGIATFTLSQAFATGGSLRPGWMQLTFWSDGDHGFAASATGGGLFDGQFGCSGSAQIMTLCYNNSLQPILLGRTMPIDMLIQVSRSSIAPGYSDGGGREVFLQAQFFEINPLNGLPGAPAQVSLAPEPAALWLCGIGFGAAAILRRRLATH